MELLARVSFLGSLVSHLDVQFEDGHILIHTSSSKSGTMALNSFIVGALLCFFSFHLC